MASGYNSVSATATSTQQQQQHRMSGDSHAYHHGRSLSSQDDATAASAVADPGGGGSWGDAAVARAVRNSRSESGGSMSIYHPRGGGSAGTVASGPRPGSFSSELKSMNTSRSVTPRPPDGAGLELGVPGVLGTRLVGYMLRGGRAGPLTRRMDFRTAKSARVLSGIGSQRR